MNIEAEFKMKLWLKQRSMGELSILQIRVWRFMDMIRDVKLEKEMRV